MLIMIPSKGRSGQQITADQLRAADLPFAFVCSKDDTPEHLRAYKSTADIMTSPAKSISEKRQWILDHCGGPKLVMLDDDLVFYARVGKTKFRRATAEDVQELFYWIDGALDDYAHCGIVDKFMSNTTPRDFVLSRRYNSVLGYNKELFPLPRPKFRIPVSEEHDVHLQLATRGLPPIVSTEWSKGTSYYNAGGCTGERSAKSEERGHRLFAEKWPDLVKVIPHKTNISGLAIRVRWRKAAEIGSKYERHGEAYGK